MQTMQTENSNRKQTCLKNKLYYANCKNKIYCDYAI